MDIEKYVTGIDEVYQEKSYIIREGDPFKGLFYVRQGLIKILKKDSSGKDQLICFVAGDDIIGVTTFFNDERYQFSALAMCKCDILFINPKQFDVLLKNSNELNKKIMEILVQRIHVLENRMTNISNLSVQERLAESLIYYSLSNKNIQEDIKNNNDVTINYSIDELAGITGSTNGYIAKLLNQFSNNKLIERIDSNKLRISDYMGLVQMTNAALSDPWPAEAGE